MFSLSTVLPKFGVTMEMPKTVSLEDEETTFTVKAK